MAPDIGGDDGLPLEVGDHGDAVLDLQRRLAALVDGPALEAGGTFDEATADAVRRFQRARGLHEHGRCDRYTWAAVVEAGFRPGDRLLYLRRPMLRGDDVAALQRRLGALGFDAGRVDGIFGPDTEAALREFQRNSGITTDAVCGPEVVNALARLGSKVADGSTGTGVAGVREGMRLREGPRGLTDRHVAVGETGGLGALAAALGSQLQRAGGRVVPLQHPDWSVQARQANELDAEIFLALEIGPPPTCASFYATEGFASVGGRHLARLITDALPFDLFAPDPPRGMRHPILRETRMPAVVIHLAPPDTVVAELRAAATGIARGVGAWVDEPIEP